MDSAMGFHYPNEEIYWSFMIVLYPYITGLVAGAFIVSSLYHVFNVKALRPVARISLLAAFCFLCFATTPLLLHLGRPLRALNIMATPNLRSAMAGFGFIYLFYSALVVAELWFAYRADLIRWGKSASGLKASFYSALALWSKDLSPQAVGLDEKLVKILASIGVPSACILHGYVGFIFGAIKANHWWSSELMPIIFILSAIVSGIAALTLMYLALAKLGKIKLDKDCLRAMTRCLWFFLIIDVVIEALEFLNMGYKGVEGWSFIRALIFEHLFVSLLVVQFLIGSVVPLILLGVVWEFKLPSRARNFVVALCSSLVLIQVLAMRWNVVIGGQILSKSQRGFLPLEIDILGKEGLLLGIVVLLLPFVLFAVISAVCPPWEEITSGSQEKDPSEDEDFFEVQAI